MKLYITIVLFLIIFKINALNSHTLGLKSDTSSMLKNQSIEKLRKDKEKKEKREAKKIEKKNTHKAVLAKLKRKYIKRLTITNHTTNDCNIKIYHVKNKVNVNNITEESLLIGGTFISARNSVKFFDIQPDLINNEFYRIVSTYTRSDNSKFEKTHNIYINSISTINRRKTITIDDEKDLFKDSIEVTFVGKGNLQQALSNKEEIPANTGIGILLNKNFARSKIASFLEAELVINVASTVDTIKAKKSNATSQMFVQNASDFGNYLLIPTNSGRAGYFASKLYFRNPLFNWFDGLTFSFSGSSRVWKYNNDTIFNTAAFAIRAGLFDEYTPFRYKAFSVLYGIDFSFRGIYGDAGQKSNNNFRAKIFNGNDDPNFFGIQPYVAARLQNLKAEMAVTYLYSEKGDIPGLTGWQLIVGISYVGGFPLKISW